MPHQQPRKATVYLEEHAEGPGPALQELIAKIQSAAVRSENEVGSRVSCREIAIGLAKREIMITGVQVRGARAMLRWSPQEVARRSKLSVETIRRTERVDGDAALTTAQEQGAPIGFKAAGHSFPR
jgi:hypothetical protein